MTIEIPITPEHAIGGDRLAPEQRERPSPEHARRVIERVGAFVIDAFRAAGSPDFSVGLSVGGRRAYIVNGRALDESEIPQALSSDVQLGCLLKPLIAVVALELAQRGLFDLRDPIGKYLVELSKDKKGRHIQVQHLISHTPGYLAFPEMPPGHRFRNRESALSEIRVARQLFSPGTMYNYDHSATAMLGEILEGLTNRSIPNLVNELILAPLGYEVPTPAHRSLKVGNSSVADEDFRSLFDRALPTTGLLSLVESLMSNDNSSSVSCISPPILEALHKPIVEMPRTPGSAGARYLPIGHSLGLHAFRNGFLGYDTTTRSQASGFRFEATRQVAIVVVTQPRYRIYRTTILGDALDLMDDTPALIGTENEATQDAFRMGHIVGTYSGNHNFDAKVWNVDRKVICAVRQNRGSRTEIRGEMDERGQVFFRSKLPVMDPSFFRYSRTGETCMIFGMFILKRMNVWRRILRGLNRPG